VVAPKWPQGFGGAARDLEAGAVAMAISNEASIVSGACSASSGPLSWPTGPRFRQVVLDVSGKAGDEPER